MFVWDYGKKTLVNVNHIVRVFLSEPYLEQMKFRVACTVENGGSLILMEGTKEECLDYMANFADKF